MSLDTKYRPQTYDDVLGQEHTKLFLKAIVRSKKQFSQSLIFAGPHGDGKTTLARIFVRAALCENPQDGEPCDECESCLEILKYGTSECFIEVDAATNSGKDAIKAMLEEIMFDTFSGKRRIYLFDEAHQLTREALDAKLKSLEENLPGTDEKRLVCVFCTTEPEKMRETILSRCAPAFQIQPVDPEIIAGRLEYICEAEGIEFEKEALRVIAAAEESHIRDAIKAVEGISMLGPVTMGNVQKFLRLDRNDLYLDLLLGIGEDLGKALELAQEALSHTSPAVVYKKLSELAMVAYKVHLGSFHPPVHLDSDKVHVLSKRADVLLGYVTRFASHPGKPTPHMLQADLGCLHHGLGSPSGGTISVKVEGGYAPAVGHTPASSPEKKKPHSQGVSSRPVQEESKVGKIDNKRGFTTTAGVCVVHAGVNRRDEQKEDVRSPGTRFTLPADEFARHLGLALQELEVTGGGRS